jgi:hypothetical protein
VRTAVRKLLWLVALEVAVRQKRLGTPPEAGRVSTSKRRGFVATVIIMFPALLADLRGWSGR